MANRFHFNPATGQTGRCFAQYSCRLGQSAEEHGETHKEARDNYEALMSPDLLPTLARKQTKDQLTSPNLPDGVDATPLDPSTMTIDELPEGMHQLTSMSGTDIRNYDPSANPRFERNIYIGGKHLVRDRAQRITLSNGRRAWAIPVLTEGTESTLVFPMRQLIPVATQYTPNALAARKKHDEEDKARRAAEEASREAARKAQERIATTPYENLSAEDRVVADRMRIEEELERAREEEKRWDKEPNPVYYEGPERRSGGNVRGHSRKNNILETIRRVPDYDLKDYNERVKELSSSDLSREEQEKLIRTERINYVSSLNNLLDRRAAAAQTVRAPKEGLKATVRSFFQRDEEDLIEQRRAEDSIREDRQAMRGFAEKLFKAPFYAQISASEERYMRRRF